MSEKEEEKKTETEAEKPKKAPRARKTKKETPAKKAQAPKKKPKEEVPAEAEKAEERTVTKGDFILVEMTGKAVETGEVFDTTDEEKAKSAGIHSEKNIYGPQLVVVGQGWVLKGLDARLEGLKVGSDTTVEIPPQEAFGERDPESVRMVPFRLLRSKGINPTIGAQVEVDGRTAVVRSIGAGRVQLDYNPPLAGRKITYTVKITERCETDEEKVKALIKRRFPGFGTDKFNVRLTKKAMSIEVPEEIFFAENLQIAKRGLAVDIQSFFPIVEGVEYREVHKRKA